MIFRFVNNRKKLFVIYQKTLVRRFKKSFFALYLSYTNLIKTSVIFFRIVKEMVFNNFKNLNKELRIFLQKLFKDLKI